MIDTHTHLYLEEFDTDGGGQGAVERALSAGVSHMVFPNVDLTTVERMMSLHALYPKQTSMAIGLHPTEVNDDWEHTLGAIRHLLDRGGWVAVGEVGMDLYWDKTYRAEQMEVFRRQLGWAKELDLPVIIHCREALAETLECIEQTDSEGLKLLFHSFTGTVEDVRLIREVVDTPLFGINGVATFKNAHTVREAVVEIGSEHLVLETDSPYLAPVPHRGKRNESAYLVATASSVSSTLGMQASELESVTDRTAAQFFSLR